MRALPPEPPEGARRGDRRHPGVADGSPTNRIFKDWPKVFPDALNAQVIAERLTERCERFIMDGKGFRDPRE
jgi:hypothetical protein